MRRMASGRSKCEDRLWEFVKKIVGALPLTSCAPAFSLLTDAANEADDDIAAVDFSQFWTSAREDVPEDFNSACATAEVVASIFKPWPT